MKKIYFLIIIMAVSFSGWSQLLTEDFNYPAGQLLTANGWTAHSGAGTNPITVTAPGLTYAGHPGSGIGNAVTMTTSGEDDNKTFTAINTGNVYFSFLINVSAATATGDYCVGLLQNATIFPYRVYIKTDGASGFFFGVSKANGAIVYETTSRNFLTTYFIVGKYTFNTVTTTDDVLNLWVNPALGGTETAATIPNVTGTSTDGTALSAIYLRQGGATIASTQQVDAFLVGTTWAEVTPSGAVSPTLTATALTGFGNVCINTTAGPNSFTITGTALTTANVTVGALAGFTYSTTAGGTYTNSLSLTQPGGSYSQQIFVRFTPTAVQSYNGNIPVGGGGATSINVAATGAGVNTIASVTTGAATAITQTSATLAGTITANGCSAITAYGVEYSIINGFPNGSGTAVPSSNLSGGNFSSNVTGLTPGVTYYYHAYATNAGGTGYGAQQSFTTIALTPVIAVTPLAAFGNVCINTVAGPNTFTINGNNLTTANINVGPLAGYSFSTTSGGTYTASLSLTQPGGTYSQTIYVRFTPTAVQSYNGNIPVTGGGAPPTSVAASGSGVNTAPSVTSGAASAITQNTATVAGTIPSIGCSAITAYGIEYSTTNGFPNGSGTAVPSNNLSAGNFSSALTGLAPSTTYYYHAYATNAGGTTYGAQGSFTTAAPVLSATPLNGFGAVCINTTAGPNSFVINSNGVTAANITVGPLDGYTFSTTATGAYTTSLNLTHAAGPYSQTVYVKFSPTVVQSYNGNIPVGGGGAATINVPASGSGVNSTATVVTGAATVLSPTSVTLNGSVGNNGCSAVTIAYGIEYSGISGLANGLGTKVLSTNLNAGNFSATVNGLVPGGTYYYKAFAANNGGIAYGAERSFTLNSIQPGFIIYDNPVKRGASIHYSYKGIKPGRYEVQIFSSNGQLVYQRSLVVPVDFINDYFTVPGNLANGVYSLHIVSPDFRDKKIFMIR